MTLRFLLDTTVVSAPFRIDPPASLLQRLNEHAGSMALGVLSWHELRFGHALLPESRRKEALGRYLHQVVLPSFPLLPYDRAAAEWHAAERARLRKLGVEPPIIDAQIAAIAATRGLVLVTHNLADFSPFQGLVVEDWLQ